MFLFRFVFAAAMLATSTSTVIADGLQDESNSCLDIDIEPFHMVPDGSCAVRDYWEGSLQTAFYPYTISDHQFNCEIFGELTQLPNGLLLPASVESDGNISGTIGGNLFSGKLLSASQTNWYANFCEDPYDVNKPCLQLAQPFLNLLQGSFVRVTEVSIIDGVITFQKNDNKTVEVPILIATRAAGINQLESLDPLQVGSSTTLNLLGLVTYDVGDMKAKVLSGSADILLQGHILFPDSVENDPGAAKIRGSICSEDLYKILN
jgi:hypothetical protein